MSARLELVWAPLLSMRRALLGWSIGLGLLILVTVAFWPAFRGSSGISEAIGQLPPSVVQAFGLQDFGTPAGFLRGNLYELIVPLLVAGAAVAMANGQTAGQEDAGRLELVLTEPVSRVAVFLGRVGAVLIWLAVLTVVLLVVQLVSDAAFDLAIDPGLLISTIVLCVLLGLLHGALAFAIAGAVARPAVVLATGIAVALFGYIVAALFPLSDLLRPWRVLSPWSWALGGDPLTTPAEPWRWAALLLPAVALVAIGTIAFRHRDVRTA